jgi:hypothetical protein
MALGAGIKLRAHGSIDYLGDAQSEQAPALQRWDALPHVLVQQGKQERLLLASWRGGRVRVKADTWFQFGANDALLSLYHQQQPYEFAIQ